MSSPKHPHRRPDENLVAISGGAAEIVAELQRARDAMAKGGVRSITIEAIVRRADGSAEDLGVVSYESIDGRRLEVDYERNEAGVLVPKGRVV